MKHIKIRDGLIRLIKKESVDKTTPAKAINEAIKFCKENNLTECELSYDGFLFYINQDSDLKRKVEIYYRSKGLKKNK